MFVLRACARQSCADCGAEAEDAYWVYVLKLAPMRVISKPSTPISIHAESAWGYST